MDLLPDDAPFELASDQPHEVENVTIAVKWATSAGNFLPFTALPKRYAGKLVELVIIGNADQP